MQQSSDEEVDHAPIGDIAELTASVSENASLAIGNQADFPVTSARVRVYTSKKNKGVGKGCSGSSGTPAPKRAATCTVSKPPADDSTSEEDTEDDDEDDDNINATQTIMVGSTRGYFYYPGYLFDVPPKKLKTDNLHKKLMISEIKRSETQTQFYERGMVLMGHLKEFIHKILSGNAATTSASQKKGNEDHDYAMNNTQDEDEEGQQE